MHYLPDSEWLDKAKRLAVGSRIRVRHGTERRLNLVIANERDCYWAYCQACKFGGKVLKSHVLLGTKGTPIIENPTQELPTDLVPYMHGDPAIWETVERFLVGKDMASEYLRDYNLRYSQSKRRIVVSDIYNHLSMGRDITERSNMKWVEYMRNATVFSAKQGRGNDVLLITEDTFSACKVAYAAKTLLRGEGSVDIVSSLGTSIEQPLLHMAIGYKIVFSWFDCDDAGSKATALLKRHLRPFGVKVVDMRWDSDKVGTDPKNHTIESICCRLQ